MELKSKKVLLYLQLNVDLFSVLDPHANFDRNFPLGEVGMRLGL
jgi:hypothetical protein